MAGDIGIGSGNGRLMPAGSALGPDAAGDAGDLVVWHPEGLYCPAGDFYIDPMRAVPRAVITHAHADHARRGHAAYLAAQPGAAVLRARLGALPLQTLAYGERLRVGEVSLSLHPAGHVLGSAQVRIEHRGRVWVVTGDYFLSARDEANPTCAPFEPVRAECFVSECTFGLPLYRWPRQAEVMADINAWWQTQAAEGCTSILTGYSFGKAQRLLAGLDPSIGPLVVHRSVAAMNEACRAGGMRLPEVRVWGEDAVTPADLARAVCVMPPGTADGEALRRQASESRTAFASGWMQLRARRRQAGLDRGFVLSDHADWPGLLRAIEASGASRVILMHGYVDELAGWLRGRGWRAGGFGDDRLGPMPSD